MESIARTWGRKGVLGFFSGNSAGTVILSSQAKLFFDFACCRNWQLQCTCPYMLLALLWKPLRIVHEDSSLFRCMLELFTGSCNVPALTRNMACC